MLATPMFDSKVLRVWPWPLTYRGHPRSKIFSQLQSSYTISYLSFIDIFSLSQTVFEIFEIKVFRIWPRPLTFKRHPRSKIVSPFESPYMTSYYLTFIVTYSLFRTVFEIFDIKVSRVWPWLLTFRGHPRSKIFSPFKSPCMTPSLTFIDTFSLFRTVFEIFDIKVFRFDLWPLGITQGQKYFHHLKAHIWLFIKRSLTLSLYSVPFSRYLISKFLRFDLWPLGITQGQNYFHHSKAHIWLIILI